MTRNDSTRDLKHMKLQFSNNYTKNYKYFSFAFFRSLMFLTIRLHVFLWVTGSWLKPPCFETFFCGPCIFLSFYGSSINMWLLSLELSFSYKVSRLFPWVIEGPTGLPVTELTYISLGLWVFVCCEWVCVFLHFGFGVFV